jgi:transposase
MPALDETIGTVMILKEKLKSIWAYRSRPWASKALDHWCSLARSLTNPSLNAFANMLDRHRDGTLNHNKYAIHTVKLEAVNNKIKVIKRKGYGFHDLRYFTLKIYQTFYH